MSCNAVIISTPHLNLDQFIASANQALGQNLAYAAEKLRTRDPAEIFTSCLAAMLDPDAPAGLHEEFLSHLTYSVLIVCPVWDLLPILSLCSGMPFVASETKDTRYCAALVTGSLQQWRMAVENGTALRQPDGCRECFCRIMERFESQSLGKLWAGRNKQWDAEHLYYLKHDRN